MGGRSKQHTVKIFVATASGAAYLVIHLLDGAWERSRTRAETGLTSLLLKASV